MVSVRFGAAVTAAVVVLSTAAAATCSTQPYAKCGSNTEGVSCCPDKYYCQPWDAGFFQCMPQPAQCSQQLPNTDLYGNDIKTVLGVQPSECCTQCTQTAGCVAYTFVNSNPGQPACYLKSAVGASTASVGAVSGIVNGGTPTPTTTAPTPTTTAPTPTTTAPTPTTTAPTPTTTAPTPTTTPPTPTTSSPSCGTAAFGNCGSSDGSSCCPSGYYCQPWNPTYYQCIATPPKCSSQQTDVDYYGNDIKTVYVSLPSLCCDECASTPGCKAYTYVNNNPGQPACYLKSATGAPTRLVGGVSGKLN